MKPFAHKLNITFNLALGQSKKVMLMQHLEVSNSMEESLLLLMGLSRLPGNRQFVPQADATIELRVKEGNGIGKTFQETPVIIGVRLADVEQKSLRRLWSLFARQFSECEVGNRPGRLEPRVIKRRRHHYKLMQKPREELRSELRKHCT